MGPSISQSCLPLPKTAGADVVRFPIPPNTSWRNSSAAPAPADILRLWIRLLSLTLDTDADTLRDRVGVRLSTRRVVLETELKFGQQLSSGSFSLCLEMERETSALALGNVM